MVGNLSVITLILLSSQLYTHIYFLLSNLSFIHLCHSTIITPKILVNFLTNKNVILYPECMTQLIFSLFAIEECHMLAVMAYDCHVANCTPLRYVRMSHHLCLGLIVVVYTLGFIRSSIHRSLMLKILLCKTKVITHYFCDLFPLLELSSSKVYINEFLALFLSALSSLTPTLTILTSYIFIVASIPYIKSTEGKFKTFSTFSSHTLLFPSYLVQLHSCIQPSSVNSMNQEKLSFVLYTTVLCMLNPMI
uniref:putative olfactory receptor 8G3 pseudogene n=1 Tax=Jaculus jaculus TaxID=51337 RepID=UPI001E1B2BBD|nr:putative olfactory receptor 8G3 pseudogene [Jaculus jaculus]